MNALRVWMARLQGLLRARGLDRDLEKQIAAHLDEAAEDYMRQGLSPAAARQAAGRDFGRLVTVREAWRETRSLLVVDSAVRDLQHATRGLRRSPGFAGVVIAVLGLGMGAVTAVFTLLNAVVLRPLPYTRSNELVTISHAAPGLGSDRVGLSNALYFAYAGRAQSLASVAVYRERVVLNLRLPGSATEPVQVTYASAAVFRILNVSPERGRLFTEADGRPGFLNTTWRIPVLISHRFWAERFGSDPSVIGREIRLNDTAREIVGVLPAAFTFPRADTQVWMLLEPAPALPGRTTRGLSWDTIARVRQGTPTNAVAADLARIIHELEADDQELARARLSPIVTPLKSAAVGDVARVLWLLFGGMLLLLFVAGANTAGLFLVRAEHRSHEIAVRRALGAGNAHLARLFFVEASVLCAAAAVLAVLLSKGLVRAVLAHSPFELPRSGEIAMDPPSIIFTAVTALTLAVFCAALSGRQRTRTLHAGLAVGDQRSTARGRGFTAADALIVLQVAVALTLLAGSALMVRTYRNLAQLQLGFSPRGLITVEIGLPTRKARQHVRIYQSLVERVRQVPQVQSATLASFVPFTPAEDVYPVGSGTSPVEFKFFAPGYLQTMGTPAIEGLSFASGERGADSHPILVSAALARRLFPGQRAVGQHVSRLNSDGTPLDMGRGAVPPFTVAGVVADTRETAPRDGPTEIVYIPLIDPPVEVSIVPTNMRLVVRTGMPLAVFAPLARAAVADVDPDLSVGTIETMDAIVTRSRAREAFVGTLLIMAAALSLLLGAVGIYGAVAQVVRRRTREIGIRLALGGSRGEMIWMVTAGSTRLVLIGSALGLALGFPAAGLLESFFFGVSGRDPGVWLAVVSLLLVSAAVAAVAAARRASSMAPVVALRSE